MSALRLASPIIMDITASIGGGATAVELRRSYDPEDQFGFGSPDSGANFNIIRALVSIWYFLFTKCELYRGENAMTSFISVEFLPCISQLPFDNLTWQDITCQRWQDVPSLCPTSLRLM